MNNILVISKNGSETETLSKELRTQEDCDVVVASTPDEAIEIITMDRIDLVVFNIELFTRKRLQTATDFRGLGYTFPLLVLAHTVLPEIYYNLEQMESTVILEKPYDHKDLMGLTEKLVDGVTVKQRIFRRYDTNQSADFLAKQYVTPIRIKNLSQGGAYLECDASSRLVIGEKVKLEIPLNQVSKTYKMEAKVVWVMPEKILGKVGVGVEFIR